MSVLQSAREGKEILANEIGVVFKPKSKRTELGGAGPAFDSLDPKIVSVSGEGSG